MNEEVAKATPFKKTPPWVATHIPDFCYKSKLSGLMRALRHTVADKELIQHRNKDSLQIFTDLQRLYPAINEALEDERQGLLAWVDEACLGLIKNDWSPATVTFGEWWFYLLKEPQSLIVHSGLLKVVLRESNHMCYDPESGEPTYYNDTWVSVEDISYAKAEEARLAKLK